MVEASTMKRTDCISGCWLVKWIFPLLLLASQMVLANVPTQELLPPIGSDLSAPTAVAAGPDGRVYIVEPSADKVTVYTSSGQYLTGFSGLSTPTSVAVSQSGSIYIGNAGRNSVEVYDSNHTLLGKLGIGDGEFVRPSAIAIAPDGTIHVTDSKAHLVKVYNPDRSFGYSFGGRGSDDGQFFSPTAIAIDQQTGEILVADLADLSSGKSARVQVFNQNGTFNRILVDKLRPLGVAIDNESRVYVSDSYHNTVSVYSSTGTWLVDLDDSARPLRTPLGMAYAPQSNRLYVASMLSASVETYGMAGAGPSGGSEADQIAPVVTPPQNIAVDVGSALLIASTDPAIAAFLNSATASDDVDGVLTAITHDAQATFPVGMTTVTFSAMDAAGNTGSAQATVTVLRTDNDGDGLPNDFEIANGLDPDDPSDADGDLDGDGVTNIEEYQQGTNIALDEIPPVLSIPGNLVVNSTGPLTPVDLSAVTASDTRDGTLVPLADNFGPFAPGRHVIHWSVRDAASNEATGQQVIDVIPLASFVESQVTGEGTTIIVSVRLNGTAVTYPVTIPYSVTGTANNPSDHDAQTGEVTLAEGRDAQIIVNIVDDGIGEGDENIIFTMGDPTNAAKGGSGRHVVRITEVNAPPQVSLTAAQAGIDTSEVTTGAGLVVITPTVSDPNPGDSHLFDWSLSDNALVPQEGYDGTTFTFDPSVLNAGIYTIALRLDDTGAPSLSGEVQLTIRVLDDAPLLTDGDSDGDGIDDASEGHGDSDGDGASNYQDAVSEPSLLQTQIGYSDRYLLQTDAGLKIRMGQISFATGKSVAMVTEDDVVNYGGIAGGVADEAYSYPMGLYDFDIDDLAEPGVSARVIIPLTGPIPANALYRKYINDPAGWQDFYDDGVKNSIASAPGELGVCPAPGDVSYVAGLIEGYYCVQLTIEDGGLNDADGIADGSISDPGGIAEPAGASTAANPAPAASGGGGGAFGLPLLVLLWAMALIVMWDRSVLNRLNRLPIKVFKE